MDVPVGPDVEVVGDAAGGREEGMAQIGGCEDGFVGELRVRPVRPVEAEGGPGDEGVGLGEFVEPAGQVGAVLGAPFVQLTEPAEAP